MDDDILCPTCAHSLAFHKFDYGSCEAPLGGLTSKNVCGCGFTIHAYIQKMEPKEENIKKYWQLEKKYETCMDEIVNSLKVLKLAQQKIEFLESKLKVVRELIEKIKPVENGNYFVSGWKLIGYRNEVTKIIEETILELEKDMENV